MSQVQISAPNPIVSNKIEQITEEKKKTLTQKTFYTQYTQSKVEKKHYDKLQEWMNKIKQDKEDKRIMLPETQVAVIQDGLIFDDGKGDSNTKQKLMFNKEKELKRRFEKEIADKNNQSGLKKQAKDAYRMGVKIKVSNVMFFEEKVDEQKQDLDQQIREFFEIMKEENGIFLDMIEKILIKFWIFLQQLQIMMKKKQKYLQVIQKILYLINVNQYVKFRHLVFNQLQSQIILIKMEDSKLHKLFMKYSHQKEELNNFSFVKIFKDAKLVGSNLKSTDLDILFSKVKSKGKQKINYEQFLKGIEMAAVEKQVDHDKMVQKIENLDGPHFKGTKAQNVKLHDDKTTYTGVYAKGGPKTVDLDNERVVNFDHYASRDQCKMGGGDMRTVKHDQNEAEN